MAYLKIPLLICWSCLLFSFTVKAQTDPVKTAELQLNKWIDKYPQEKVYLHTDKPYYATGDDIWFKAYVVLGPKHELSALSGVLNVELIDSRDSLKQAIKIPVIAGTATGDFTLSDTLTPGSYRIRAYTQWMRNFGPDYFFDKTISITSAAANAVFTNTLYSYSTQNGVQATTANITFTDINRSALSNKEVSYQALLNGKQVLKGKGITDAKGGLVITFPAAQNAPFRSGRIIAKIKTDPKTTITKEIAVKAVSGNIDVQFFPESGPLVYGLPSKIAFKAIGANGLGATISGIVTDNENNQVVSFNTQHLGMGVFILVPIDGKTYKAAVTFADGSQKTINLPLPVKEGVTIAVNSITDPENIGVRIYASQAFKNTEINLIAQSGGVLCYAGKNTLPAGAIYAKIPKSKFPRGIIQFTLFNAAGEPISERVVFLDKPDDLKLDITSSQANYKTRQKVNLGISAIDANKGVISTLSAAVIDNTRVPVDESDEVTILSSLLLTSDLKGYVEQPNYYFENTDSKKLNDLDVLMLTQGYSRFEWKALLAGQFAPLQFMPEKTLQITGSVRENKKPVVNGKVTLFSNKGGTFYVDTLTDGEGRFAFKNLDFPDSVRFLLQARTSKNKKFVDIDIDNTKREVVNNNPNLPDEILNDTTTTTYLQSSNKYYQQQMRSGVGNHNRLLKEVVITDKREKLKNSANLNGAGQADQIIKSDVFDKTACPNIVDCLVGRIVGVTFRNGVPYARGGPMQIYLDGIRVEPEILQSFSQYDIGSIEVLRDIGYAAIYGASNGVLLINTKRGNDENYTNKFAPGVLTYSPKGFYKARMFYSPRYDNPAENTALADLRTTILWKPNIVTDDAGKASLEYFNAGSPGTYRVVLEGIDLEGHIGRKVYRYKVE